MKDFFMGRIITTNSIDESKRNSTMIDKMKLKRRKSSK
jgi:hypothetical protein